jgi:hypothetical protein
MILVLPPVVEGGKAVAVQEALVVTLLPLQFSQALMLLLLFLEAEADLVLPSLRGLAVAHGLVLLAE